jgi:adenylate cyclase
MALDSTATRINGRDVDLSLGSVRDGKGAPVMLRPQALAVLKLFLTKPGALVSKDELMAAVWPGIAVTDDSLVKCVTEIRRALGDDKHVIVKTVSKRGYVFEPGAEPASANRRNWLAFAAALLGAVGLAAVFLWPSQKPPMAQPAIAVLPFTNLSGDPAQDYFGQGLSDDIITALSNFPTMRVMSRTSSFVYDKPVNVQKVAQELSVDYVLEGGVKNSAGKVRVTAQLIDARTGEHIWASSFDEEVADPVALQEEIAGRINDSIGGFGGEISRSEYAAAAAKPPIGLGEYDYYLRGHALWHRNEDGDNAKAREIWQAGLAKFPDSTLLRIKVALTLYRDLVYDRSDDRARDVDRGWTLIEEARADDNRTRLEELLLRWMSAWFHQYHDGDFERSVAEAEGAIKLAPYDALAYADLSNVLYNAG